MKLIEATMGYPKYGREPKDDSEILVKKVFFIPQNVVLITEEVDKPIVKTRIELAGGLTFLVTETIEEIALKINETLAAEVR